ncbi:hypothetical protein E2C01_073555 [Portunus trituberculatus]|uniref:Uncharacterized protein n=1 Tax=Portunus trituberculatus TaxID=210409 RepID=A0A5B7I9Q7_PORTR|nr:hypothetical protein [Portunus trituberculatus]
MPHVVDDVCETINTVSDTLYKSIGVSRIDSQEDYCEEYGMKINQVKTKFFVIGGREGDTEALVVNGLTVEHCQMSPASCSR